MVEYIICDYLVEKGVIKEDDAKKFVENFETHSEKLGTLALKENLLTSEQVEKIHDMQKNIDKKFGEIAVDTGMLTKDQLTYLIKRQREKMPVFDYLVEKKVISSEEAEKYSGQFKEDFRLTDEEFILAHNDDIGIISSMLVNTGDFYTNYYYSVAIKFLVRFLGLKNSISRTQTAKTHEAERIVTHKICTMRKNFIIGFSGSREAMHTLSEKLVDFDTAEFKDDIYARLKNFMNCITCVFECGIMRESPIRSISRPKLYKSAELIFNEEGYIIPATLNGYDVSIIVAAGVNDDFAKVVHNV